MRMGQIDIHPWNKIAVFCPTTQYIRHIIPVVPGKGDGPPWDNSLCQEKHWKMFTCVCVLSLSSSPFFIVALLRERRTKVTYQGITMCLPVARAKLKHTFKMWTSTDVHVLKDFNVARLQSEFCPLPPPPKKKIHRRASAGAQGEEFWMSPYTTVRCDILAPA